MLDAKNSLENFGYIGYQPPQNALDPDSLVADGYVPRTSPTAVVTRGVVRHGLPPARAAAARRRRLAPDLAGVQGRRLTARGAARTSAGTGGRAAGCCGRSCALPGMRLAGAAVRRAAVRRAGHRLRRRRSDVPHAVPVMEPVAVGHRPVRSTCSPHLRRRRVLRPGAGPHRRVRADRQRLCLLIAYPVAYYTARLAGRWQGLLLALLIAPFWISYMMRMLAWVNLLAERRAGEPGPRVGGLFPATRGWLGGRASWSFSVSSTATCRT